ncbi:MAG: hypothetical protein HXS41_13120 [Theionarchaea archaeon]|nr:hypothetical protein [Theionarchaea archaeon]MBU7000623.1 hypothetical protein [Theionarchaea archaeon]MBU7021994.1 hypothetical protein [Theionarchaea archaeon]MBU7036087.1 hypothetical protein [Theionarchaea archaeon]MBU7041677.1 hypothetical protein [Theionarchaea archaeon]
MDESTEDKAEIRIIADKGSLEAVEYSVELLRDLIPTLPEISKEKVEEAIELMSLAREKILPEVPTIKELVDTLGERETEVQVRFNNLTVDGETRVLITPLRKIQDV